MELSDDAYRSKFADPTWPLERALFALAGSMTLLSVLLAVTVSSWFLILTALVGVNQWLYVLVRRLPRVAGVARGSPACARRWRT